MLGTHLIRGWSATQRVIALSSGEAEYFGVVRGRQRQWEVKAY